MSQSFHTTSYILGTGYADVFSATSNTLTLLVQAVNNAEYVVNCELFLTDGAHLTKSVIIPFQNLEPKKGVSDTTKHVIPSAWKLWGKASVAGVVYVEVTTLEGVP
ncbi:MAG: hypothetical protein D4S01_08055 [Dehalococcoidia bacterium]|nr:MAG: hypothetical protein D4S01_08055 [Dehalococcoidia bacterium]